ncbi:ATPase, partial [Vibrio anguillarum]|nr:ATPase [Vibrio anguillarum]
MSINSMQIVARMKNGLSFRNRVFILIFCLMMVQLSLVSMNFHTGLINTLEHQVGTRALIQAKEIA